MKQITCSDLIERRSKVVPVYDKKYEVLCLIRASFPVKFCVYDLAVRISIKKVPDPIRNQVPASLHLPAFLQFLRIHQYQVEAVCAIKP